jgi:hypothetical protein
MLKDSTSSNPGSCAPMAATVITSDTAAWPEMPSCELEYCSGRPGPG